MKISVDVLGVEQSLDFNTLKSEAYLVVDILGVTVRVPISEEQMEGLTKQAVLMHQKVEPPPKEASDSTTTTSTDDLPFQETRETFADGEQPSGGAEETGERTFSVMERLDDRPPQGDEPQGETPAGLEGVFGNEDDTKLAQLRERARLQPRKVAQDDMGNPLVETKMEIAAPTLPQLPGTQDDDFPQG